MIRNLITKKELILDAALKIVAENNTFNITIREIASQANVNVAAINYYFKSKSHLFNEMEEHFMSNFEDAFTPLDDENLSCEQRLHQWLKKAIGYATHYPGILVLLRDKINNTDTSNPKDSLFLMDMMKRLSQLRQLFQDVVQPSEKEMDHLFLSFGATLLSPFFADIKGLIKPLNEQEHYEYVLTILNKLKK